MEAARTVAWTLSSVFIFLLKCLQEDAAISQVSGGYIYLTTNVAGAGACVEALLESWVRADLACACPAAGPGPTCR